jgi:hypothetical protein
VSSRRAAAWLIALALPGRAYAEDAAALWPGSAPAEEDRLGRFLEDSRAEEKRDAWVGAAGALAVGLPQIGVGSWLLTQNDNVAAQSIGPGMIIGGSVDCLLAVGPLLAPTPMSVLLRRFEEERAAGKPAAQVVHDTEEAWRKLVGRQRIARRVGGIVELSLGIPLFATGLVFALGKPGLWGMSPQTQYGWAGALVGFDFAIYSGAVALAAPPPIDTAFEMYQRLKYGDATPPPVKVSLQPVPGGAFLALGVAF